MARKHGPHELAVAMNGERVGLLTRLQGGTLRFVYDESWLHGDRRIPISLSMPLASAAYDGPEVANYFDNLLPDSPSLRERIQRVLGARSTRPFDLLAAAGRDCVGALQLLDPAVLADVRCVESDPVDEGWISDRLRSYRRHPLGMAQDEQFRISVAGAQEKLGLLRLAGRWHLPRGATPTSHLLKQAIGRLDGSRDFTDSVENEWLSLRVAEKLGLAVADARIEEFAGVRVLVVERFDRRWVDGGAWLERLPQEDACQALGLPPTSKYESDGGPGIQRMLDLLLQSSRSGADRNAFFRSQVVFWLLAAIDGHGKNFSLRLEPEGRCHLTPLYDVLSAHPLVARGQMHARDLRMAMAVHGESRHYDWWVIHGRHWATTAKQSRFSTAAAREILDDCIARVPAVVGELEAELPNDFPDAVAGPILEGLAKTAARA